MLVTASFGFHSFDQDLVYQAPDLKRLTGRQGWHEDSPVLGDWKAPEYELRPQAAITDA